MQIEEMLKRANTITPNSIWMIDSTFKINRWRMSLFAGMFINTSRLDKPIFIMLCSDDNENGQVGMTLWFTYKSCVSKYGYNQIKRNSN